MKKNVGSIDKVVRLILAAIAIYFAHSEQFGITVSYILYAIAIVLILVAVFSFCPLYPVLGFSSCKKKEQ